VVAVEHLDIAVGGGTVHVVPHHLKHAVEVGGDDDMDELLRHQTRLDALAADDLHVLVGVLHLNVHQLVQEAGKPGAVGPVQQQAEHIKVVVDVIQHLLLMVGGVLSHIRTLFLLAELVKILLYPAEHGLELIHHRLCDGPEQPLLIPEAGIDRAGAGICRLSYGAQRSVQKPLGQKLLLGALQHLVIDTRLLFCHCHSSSYNKFQS